MSEKLAEEIRKAVRDEISRVLQPCTSSSFNNASANTSGRANENTSLTSNASTSNGSTSASESSTMTFEDFYKKREKARQGDFKFGKPSKKQKLGLKKVNEAEVEVEIKVGVASQKDGVIKPRRGKSQVIKLKRSSTKEVLLSKAIKKHSLFDQTFDESEQYTLLYPDYTEVNTIPGTTDVFTLAEYKEASGKDYKRLTFYLIPTDEFVEEKEVVYLSDDSPERMPSSPTPAITPTPSRPVSSTTTAEKQGDPEWAPWTLDIESSDSGTEAENSLLSFAIQQSKAELDQKTPPTLAEALKQKSDEIPQENYTLIELTRKDLVSKTFESLEDEDIKPHVIVKFFGEEAVDTGGVTREYFTEFFKDISVYSDLVRGSYPNITFRHNLTALRAGKFELLGKLMAVSALNSCPGPHIFAPSLVNSLFDLSVDISLDEVPRECEYLPQLSKIVECTDNSSFMQAVNEFPERFDMGYTKAVVNLKDKGELIDTCVRHIMVSSVAEEIASFKKGLMSFGVLTIMCNFVDEAVRHFIHTDVSTEEVKKCFEPVYSSDVSENEKEVEIVYMWHHFLKLTSKGKQQSSVLSYHNLESSNEPDPEDKILSLGDVLQFGSGSRYPNFKGRLLFDHSSGMGSGRRIKANTCAFSITIPVNSRYCVTDSGIFANNITEDIFESFGFGLA